MTGPEHSSQTNDVEVGFETRFSQQEASLNVATDPAVVSERKAGHEHDAYPEGIALIGILVGVAVSFFLVFLDMTIMSTMTPAVTARFDALTDIGWYASAYQLASAACTPLTGKIYTYFQIRWSFLVFLLIFEIGFTLSGAAPSSNMFIVGRAIAGIGSAGLFTGMMTIVANVLPPAQATGHSRSFHGSWAARHRGRSPHRRRLRLQRFVAVVLLPQPLPLPRHYHLFPPQHSP